MYLRPKSMLDTAIGAIFIGLSFQITAIWETPTPLRLAPSEPSKAASRGWFNGRNAGDR